MRVLLINPLHPLVNVDRPTLGIAYLAAVLSKLPDMEVHILDLTVERMETSDLLTFAQQYSPQMIGFSMLTSTAAITKELAHALKGVLPDTVFIVGGAHPSADPLDALADAPFDIAVIGEGELVITELAQRVATNTSFLPAVAGTYIRKPEGKIEAGPPPQRISALDSLPIPARDLLPLSKYSYKIAGRRATMICTSRGCPLGCIYCDQSVFGQSTRFRSPGNVLSEIFDVHSKGYRAFDIIDDTFTLDRNRVIEICQGIQSKKLDIVWRCLGRVDQVDPELLHCMSSAGCYQIYYGLESGSQRTLDRLGKKTNLSQTQSAVLATKDAGIRVKAFFMIGLPWETPLDIAQTLELATKLPLDGGKFSLPKPLPNTVLMQQLQNEGRLLTVDSASLAYYLEDHCQLFTYDAITHEEVLLLLQEAKSLCKGVFND
jgi:radical SAM superfamily enzyme YgiQ (UPF0313 family)